MKIKNIVILAGGDGSRFWPLKKKSLFLFNGKPLICHQVDKLKRYCDKITIVINPEYENDFSKWLSKDIRLIKQSNANGMAGAVLSCKGLINRDALIINAEDIFSTELMDKLTGKLDEKHFDIVLSAKEVTEYFPGGYIKFIDDKPVEIIEKPDPDKVPSKYVRLVVDYFADFDGLIKAIEETNSKRDDVYELAINSLLNKSKSVYCLGYSDIWLALKYPWQILPMSRFFLSKLKNYRGKNVSIDKSAEIIGEVYLEDNVKIMNQARIVGPCYIGKNSVVGSFSMVVNSMVGKNSLIGGYSEITRSYLGEEVMLHRNYIGDSVLDNDVLFGAGAVTGNYRFDEASLDSYVSGRKIKTNLTKLGVIIGANSKIGINVSILPGIKIGHNSLIGPGEVICEDVKDNMFVFNNNKVKNIL